MNVADSFLCPKMNEAIHIEIGIKMTENIQKKLLFLLVKKRKE